MLRSNLGKSSLRSLVLFCVIGLSCSDVGAIQDQDEAAVYNLLQTATNAQQAGDFEIALSQYEQVIKQHSKSAEVGKAYYNAGVCCVETGQFSRAIAYLTKASDQLGPERVVLLPQAKLLLGFSQLRLGKQLLDPQPEAARQQLESAGQNLTDLIQEHPKFVDIDQAYFFLGDAYDALGQQAPALEAYRKMLALPKVQFRQDGLFAVANLYERMGQLDQALVQYESFVKEYPNHALVLEVRFRTAETLTQMALDAATEQRLDLSQQIYKKAEPIYQSVIEAKVAELSDEARFQKAFVVSRQKDYARSAELYSQVAQTPDTVNAARAWTYAGRDYFRSGQDSLALDALAQATRLESPYAAEAAHWLAQTHLHQERFEEAFKVANQWVGKTDEPRFQVPLMLDAADAAYGTPARRQESVDLYLRVADQFPQHPTAPSALYNGAYAAMEVGQFERAIGLTKRFEQAFPDHSFLADSLEVHGDTSLLTEDSVAAEAIFRRLAVDYPNHPKRNAWMVRVGLASYLQGKYQATLQWLEPATTQLTDPQQMAEAWHWIGSSYFKLDQSQPAIAALEQSRSAAAQWRRADETLLTLSRAQAANQQRELAKATAERLLVAYPNSPLCSEAIYRLGEYAYGQGVYQEAEGFYETVLANHADSTFVPYALYGRGWSQIKQDKFKDAATTFSKLIDAYPKHSLAQQALIGRATSWRREGNAEASVMDAKRALETSGKNLAKADVLYELGLAQIQQADWKEVIKTFSELIQLAPSEDRADQFHYELAWAYRSDNQTEAAANAFQNLATQFPQSPHASEANFHVAQSAYAAEDFERAIELYKQSLATGKDAGLNEKATYKLAWSHYQRGQFQESQSWFAKQTASFKEGPLYADGLFMISESLYKMRDHDLAFQAYRVAKPVVDASSSVAPEVRFLTMLHGGQSANLAKKYGEAIEFLNPIISEATEIGMQQEAYLEIGIAHSGLNETDKAMDCWELAAANLGEAGAHARCMLGDQLFADKKFTEAITQFKLTFYGYGGTSARAEVKAWQAYAAYEAARCSLVQMGIADSAAAQLKFKNEAKKHFEFLIKNYPDDRLVEQARKELAKLVGSSQ